jgi:hypothetical protein
MSIGQLFKLHPLSRALKIFSVAPLLLFCDLGYARVLVPGEVLAIDANTKQDNYVLNGASTLNANGALTRQIVVNNSTLNMQGSTVQATGATGVLLNAGRADISANTHITSDRNGLAVSRNATATQGSTAIVSDSFINGGTSGATITGLSNLTLLRTEVTGAKAMGLNIFGGTITATDSTITGNASGIEINSDPLVNPIKHTDPTGHGVGGSFLRFFGIATKANKVAQTQASEAVANIAKEAQQNAKPLVLNAVDTRPMRNISTAGKTVTVKTLEHNLIAKSNREIQVLQDKVTHNNKWLMEVNLGERLAKPKQVSAVVAQNAGFKTSQQAIKAAALKEVNDRPPTFDTATARSAEPPTYKKATNIRKNNRKPK